MSKVILNYYKHQHPYLKFSATDAELYRRTAVDLKATVGQLADKKALTAIAKKIPYAGILFSVGTNAGEFVSDKNKYKSDWKKAVEQPLVSEWTSVWQVSLQPELP